MVPTARKADPVTTPTSATGSSQAPPDHDAGYTLLELLVVLVVIALVSGLAATMFPGRTSAVELAAAARRITALAADARQQAQASGVPVTLTFDAERHALVSSAGDGREPLPDNAEIAISSMLPIETPASIAFYPDGSSSGGAIALRSGERTTRISMGWLSGQATIETTDHARSTDR